MVRVRGFEPPTSAFQVRSSGLSELHPVELAFPTGIEPACLPVRSRALVQLSYGKNWCDVWDSNPCCCAENADAWPLAERRMIGIVAGTGLTESPENRYHPLRAQLSS